jgi:hypothetical protein
MVGLFVDDLLCDCCYDERDISEQQVIEASARQASAWARS